MSKQAKEAKPKNAQVALNIDELKDFLRHMIYNNRFIQEKQNKIPIAIDVTGDSGIGKTSAIIQLGQEVGLPNFYKLNLAQIEELGDLVGFPIRQFEMVKAANAEAPEMRLFVDEHAVESYTKNGYEFTGLNQMSYCPPQWISGLKGGGILMLDDWNRADVRFIQAVMELIDRQQYISWKLPEDWHIILTSNPDDGDYTVTATDDAQKTRSIGVNLKFDIKCWGRWAENAKIDGRCINFLLMHPELINKRVNARSAVMFFNSLASITNFEDKLALITMIGEGSVGAEFANMFAMFINNKLDKIISPEDILFHKDKTWVINQLQSLTGSKTDKYRADIASTIATRIINYSLFFAKTNKVDNTLISRIGELVRSGIFQNDICYNIVKMIYNGNMEKFKAITLDKDLVKYILK